MGGGLAEAVIAGPDIAVRVMDDAIATGWRTRLGLFAPSVLFQQTIDLLQKELPDPATPGNLLAAAAAVTGTLLETAIAQRLVAEVSAGRLPPDALEPLIGPSC